MRHRRSDLCAGAPGACDWRGVLDATAPRSQCAQLALFASPETHAEDCLYHNVTVPRRVREGTPVLVWFHGGSFLAGCRR
ncbi:carboxylesterase family protein [Actinophytocola sp. NPDC049390]|uniref:carboxylesterase family protein n=1 Tax=Actinophytocola sp. NPDC049390 TaxID=3363894 RepID=UPI0037B4BF78